MTASPTSATRPRAFLVATAKTAEAERVYEALSPILAAVGTVRRVPHPESSLAFLANQADAAGQAAIQVAIGPLEECYLTPSVTSVLVPLWDYPEIPAVDLNHNGRTNWTRIASRADLILAPSQFIADAFKHAGVTKPIGVISTPAERTWQDLPTWGEGIHVSLSVPHVIWGGHSAGQSDQNMPATIAFAAPGTKHVSAGRRAIRRFKPYLSNATIEKIDRYRDRFAPLLRANPLHLVAGLGRGGYRTIIRPLLSDGVRAKLKSLKGRPNLNAHHGHHVYARVPASHLTLSGLVYSTVINYEDATIDDRSLITPFVHAFADRSDVTLVVRLETTAAREHHDLARLETSFRSPGKKLACKIVVVLGPISSDTRRVIGQATSYFVEASRSRGNSLDMIEAFASGRPTIASLHSSFVEWVNESVGFPVDCETEPTSWPIDPEHKHTTSWNRVVWADLQAKLRESAAVAKGNPKQYEELSAAARRVYRQRSQVDILARALATKLDRLKLREPGAFNWVA